MSRPLTRKRINSNKKSKKSDIPNLIDIKHIYDVGEYINVNNIVMIEKHTFTPRAIIIPDNKKQMNRLLIYKFKINDINVIYDFHPVVYDLLYQMYNIKTIESILQHFRINIQQGQAMILNIKSKKDIKDFILKQLSLYDFNGKYNIEQYIKKDVNLYLKGENQNVFKYKPKIIKDNKNDNIKKNNINSSNESKKILTVVEGEAFSNYNISNILTQPAHNKANIPTQKVSQK